MSKKIPGSRKNGGFFFYRTATIKIRRNRIKSSCAVYLNCPRSPYELPAPYPGFLSAQNYTLISTSTPEGRSIFIRASMVFVVEE